MAPRLIISDIDGTFLNSNGRVTPRLRDVVMRAVRSGDTSIPRTELHGKDLSHRKATV